jgi:hypothetical protein
MYTYTSTTDATEWNTCGICGMKYVGHHTCLRIGLTGEASRQETTDQKLDKIIELLERLIKELS